METSDVRASPGTMCAFLAAGDSHGISNSHSCVDLIWLPSGRLIVNGLVATRIVLTGHRGPKNVLLLLHLQWPCLLLF